MTSPMTADPMAALIAAIPFCAHLHLGLAEAETVALPDEPATRNHYGTAHAGALFTLGEAASGLALLLALPELATSPLLVAKTVRIDYKKPVHGRAVARGTLRDEPDAVRARLRADGKTTIDLDVIVRDGANAEAAAMFVTWYARG